MRTEGAFKGQESEFGAGCIPANDSFYFMGLLTSLLESKASP